MRVIWKVAETEPSVTRLYYYCTGANRQCTVQVTRDVYSAGWLPQQDILAADRVSLFISQLGMVSNQPGINCFRITAVLLQVSLQEAVYHRVPLLGLPFTLEQRLNGELVERAGLGTVLNPDTLTTETLRAALVTNPFLNFLLTYY